MPCAEWLLYRMSLKVDLTSSNPANILDRHRWQINSTESQFRFERPALSSAKSWQAICCHLRHFPQDIIGLRSSWFMHQLSDSLAKHGAHQIKSSFATYFAVKFPFIRLGTSFLYRSIGRRLGPLSERVGFADFLSLLWGLLDSSGPRFLLTTQFLFLPEENLVMRNDSAKSPFTLVLFVCVIREFPALFSVVLVLVRVAAVPLLHAGGEPPISSHDSFFLPPPLCVPVQGEPLRVRFPWWQDEMTSCDVRAHPPCVSSFPPPVETK